MTTTRIEKDPEGIGPDLVVTSELDEHQGHTVERTETIYDNPIEYTRWGYCHNCKVEVMVRSQTWHDMDGWLAAQDTQEEEE